MGSFVPSNVSICDILNFAVKGEVQHPGGEWRFGLLHQGVHGDWSLAFYHYLHVADFLLDVPKPLLPRPLLIVILSGGLVRIMLLGAASFPSSIHFSTRAEVLLFLDNKVLVFSGLSCLLGRRIYLVNCSNSFNKCWLVARSASTLSLLACTISNMPSRGRLSTPPGWSCILGGLALHLLVFQVDTINR